MRVLKKTLRRDPVLVLEPTMCTKVAWAEPARGKRSELKKHRRGSSLVIQQSNAVQNLNWASKEAEDSASEVLFLGRVGPER